jgi:hypothetical protein
MSLINASSRNKITLAMPIGANADRTSGAGQVDGARAPCALRRAIATRYEKTARGLMGVLCMVATIDWLKA